MIVASVVPGIHIEGFSAAFLAVIVMSLLNTFIKPILFILTFPVTVMTLGLFSLVINAGMFMLAGKFISGFSVENFSAAFIGSLVLSFITMLLTALTK